VGQDPSHHLAALTISMCSRLKNNKFIIGQAELGLTTMK
jgi:hypothetical protein